MKKNKTNTVQTDLTKIERYEATYKKGLTQEQVEQRISENLVNFSSKKYSKSYLSIFLSNTCTFFNLLGLIVAIALICVQAPLSRFFFALIYLSNILIGIIQEIRAKKCIDKLSLVSSKSTKVIRNGEEVEVLSTEIVLDDIIRLGLGNQIPTDCEIISGEVEVNEALLTGESVPVKKKAGGELFAGSFITSGTCYARAIKVGKDNYIEQLSEKAKKYKKPHSELMNSLRFIIKVVGAIIIPIATVFMVKSMVFKGATIVDAINGTSTVVIGMIPSGMFLLTSVALAVGVIKLFKKNTLVQDLYSLEMLARVDTICFDKTGTITDGRMTVQKVLKLSAKDNTNIQEVVSSMLKNLKDNNQTAMALCDFFGQKGSMIAEKILPFNSQRKLSAVTFNDSLTYSFGAPEFVLPKAQYTKIKENIDKYAQQGLRVLVLAKSSTPIEDDKAPNDFAPVALILISDNIREDAVETIKWFKDNDVAIKVISGDNPVTVSEVARRVGIDNAERYVSLEGLSDQEVVAIANEYTVFGRVSPEQKALLVQSMKAAGHVTAMTGDGVNDILAMKEADCAVSVAAGSEAARNISHLVLMDNNFNSMPKVVYEGRRVINNIQSSASLYLMKTLFTMIFAIIVLCNPNMDTYPFNLSHMILLEVFVIGLPSFFLSLQANDSRVEGNFIGHVLSKSLPSALLMVFSVSVTMLAGNALTFMGIDEKIYTTMSIVSLTFAGIISLYYICKPLNTYRAVLFFSNFVVILAVIVLSLILGLESMFSLSKMLPIKEYWHHLLIIVTVVLIDIFLFNLLEKICTGIYNLFKTTYTKVKTKKSKKETNNLDSEN